MKNFSSKRRSGKIIKENNEENELKNDTTIKKEKKHSVKDIFIIPYNLNMSVSNSTQCFSNRKETEEHVELNIIEYPFQRNVCYRHSNLDFNNFKPCLKKILSDDEGNNYNNNEDDDSSFDSNTIYEDDEYSILDSSKNDNLCCQFCEQIYKNAFNNNVIIKEKICDYCNRLINQNNLEILVKEGRFNDFDSTIENCVSYYDENKESFVSNIQINSPKSRKKNDNKMKIITSNNKPIIYTKKFVPIPSMNKMKSLGCFRINNKFNI
jgi:hypothetical protein